MPKSWPGAEEKLEPPLRAELFNLDQLRRHAQALAREHQVSSAGGNDLLLSRLNQTEKILHHYNQETTLVEKRRRITPAAEWLLDNFYLVKEQMLLIKRHLPRRYHRQLPRLTAGPMKGYPRVYSIVFELISHVDGRVDSQNLAMFISAYQTVHLLTVGELWAIPIMLRLALVENLRRIVLQLGVARHNRDQAGKWAARLLEVCERSPSSLVVEVSALAQSSPPLDSAFVAEFCRCLEGQNPVASFARNWLEHRLSENHETIESLIQNESHRQASDQVSVGNSITSMRFLSSMDWREFVETLSLVELLLRADPSGVYGDMDFATRDRCRHIVEKLARRSSQPEVEVASRVVALAREAHSKKHPDARRRHVGFYLIGPGRTELERDLNLISTLPSLARRLRENFPVALYLSAVLAGTCTFLGIFLQRRHSVDIPDWLLIAYLVFGFVALSQLSVALFNWLISLLVAPHPLPRLNFSQGIPTDARTMVVIPTMLSSEEALASLLEGLEVRYLANRDDNLFFALLTDFPDAPQEHTPSDRTLVDKAREGILQLNLKYQEDREGIFYLFHRPRRWNEAEGRWMGFERKRGKLMEFNALLRGKGEGRFSEVFGETSIFRSIKYVITLDTDTQLPGEAGRELVATISHPLNRPILDPVKKRVVQGYGILQPRVGVSLPSASRSWFVRLFASEPGIDPYTRAVSDTYQDLFGEGSFIGKGIYDVDAFEAVLQERFPENRILSHDLLEACHVRSGLVSDIALYEEHPSRYLSDVSRRHRWIRGDWQIAGWLFPRVPSAGGKQIPNALNGLSRWKIFDNLRRSLVPASLLFLLTSSWFMAADPSQFWTRVVLVIFTLPGLLLTLFQFLHKPDERPVVMHLNLCAKSLAGHMAQAGLTLAFLPFEAVVSMDAIIRSTYRVLISRKKLLAWQTSSDVERTISSDLPSMIRRMWVAPVTALATLLCLIFLGSPIHPWCGIILGLWFFSPLLAWWISLPLRKKTAPLSQAQLSFVGKIARRNWRFFETFATAGENWLPPDNFQEHPVPVIASRTSPTNMGFSLLASLAAHDFGYLGTESMLQRLENGLATFEKMERYRGHFYNWYDTRTLKPLFPLYVSTVDSGNLAASLLVLRQGLLEQLDCPPLSNNFWQGLRDTWTNLQDALKIEATPLPASIQPLIKRLENRLSATPVPNGLEPVRQQLEDIRGLAQRISAEARPSGNDELQHWCNALERNCQEHIFELDFLALPPEVLRQVPKKTANSPDSSEPGDFNPVEHGLNAFYDRMDQFIRKVNESHPPDATLLHHLTQARQKADERRRRIYRIADSCARFAEMDFEFLYDPSRKLFAIGFNASDHRRDSSYYDLLASEARLTSYLAIAQGQVRQEHWFSLGRPVTTAGGGPALISWSGSMFEYLMPELLMPSYEGTLLHQTAKGVVQSQIDYALERGVPWGISESGYHVTDVHLNYQYRAFGVPGLGLKRGLSDDLVIAPYASALAFMVEPLEACRNFEQLDSDGRLGIYGFYEAVDYTPGRVPPGQKSATVRSYMAHHQGMSFLAMASVLLHQPFQRRFLADPIFKASELLLQERVPKNISPEVPHELELERKRESEKEEPSFRLITQPNQGPPKTHLLSNGRFHLMTTAAGGGYLRWKNLALTRWREDATRDHWGQFCYIRDLQRPLYWAATHQPTLSASEHYQAIFMQARAEFRDRREDLDSHLEITVSPEDDVELRRLRLTNRSRKSRQIQITSFAEVVLAPPAADAAHPAFSNLFVQTKLVPHRHAILCSRRPRARGEQPPWMFHMMVVRGQEFAETSFETDRSKFLGRGRTAASPQAMDHSNPLSNSEGSVLDPAVAIRRTIEVKGDAMVEIEMLTGIADTEEAALYLLQKYHDHHISSRVIELAWTHSQVVLRQLNATEADAQVFGKLASSLVYGTSLYRSPATILAKNQRAQRHLWSYGISGDLPIALLTVTDTANLGLVREVVQAHAYWRMKGLSVDLIILNEDESVYRQSLQEEILSLISASTEAQLLDRPGGIFVRRWEAIPAEDRILLQSMARLVLSDRNGPLSSQADRRLRVEGRLSPALVARPDLVETVEASTPLPRLDFFNGHGGFTQDGREYIIAVDAARMTPAPWVNVLANEQFGTVISERGSSYTWSENCHEFRLTPWFNDSVSDPTGEAIYIRDDQSGTFWSPMPAPSPGAGSYRVHHGFGYTKFYHTSRELETEATVFVPVGQPLKVTRLRLRNISTRPRQFSVFGYWEWVLGELRGKTHLALIPELDAPTGSILFRNPFQADFSDRTVFADVQQATRRQTSDRTEFLGRNRTLEDPAALERQRLSGKVEAGTDPCTALQTQITLLPGEEKELVFAIGAGKNKGEAAKLAAHFQKEFKAEESLQELHAYWGKTLGTIQVETPDPSINFLANGWLLYQTLACRFWARSGFYQSGGAYGFRDQLQDAMALVHAEPNLFREHLLRAAAHQFLEGDVQHWWHPPLNQGVRTHFSDDYLWLPYAVCRYVRTSGDGGVLDEKIPFLQGRPLKPEEESYYDLPQFSEVSETLYEHCVRSIRNGLRFGEHGLPLMGCGDWNDGMNLVGEHGKGESVWLAFFLFDVLEQFAELSEARGDRAFSTLCRKEAGELQGRIEEQAWDGEWYRRAYFDNGEPLGSAENQECQIDALPQTWAILSGAGDPERSARAMEAVFQRLVRREARLIQLFTPPFDKSDQNPGYIKGYVPGVRENGGQYTHAAIWTVMGFAQMGQADRAWDLFRLVNPISHGATEKEIAIYKVEPYVVAADVYAVEPHIGRGGWTWYTGSAGWMYRLIVEWLLGLRLRGDQLDFKPCLPGEWTRYKIHYRYRQTHYEIELSKPAGTAEDWDQKIILDEKEISEKFLRLIDDGKTHRVQIRLQPAARAPRAKRELAADSAVS